MSLRNQIVRDISECKARYVGRVSNTWGMEYFNNFFAHLPDLLPEGSTVVPSRTGTQTCMPQDAPLKELVGAASGVSDLRLNQTYPVFFRAIDDALAAAEVDVSKVLMCQQFLVHFRRQNNTPATNRAYNILMDIVTPAYIRLREQGYSHYDLVQ